MFPASTKDDAQTMKNTGQSMKDHAMAGAYETRADLRDSANRAGQKVRRFINTASDELSGATSTVTSQVRSHPMQSSFMALGLGFVLGMMLRR